MASNKQTRWCGSEDITVQDLLGSARRLVVLGDETVAGFGDPRGLGWVGRVMARSQGEGDPRDAVLTITLPVPAETTSGLGARWQHELALRSGAYTWLVVAPGAHDLGAGISLARSRLNLANILDATTASHVPTLVVGPAPRNDLDLAAQAELSTAFGDVCGRRRVPYVDTFTPLVNHEQWQADLAAGDGVHPGQTGHGLLAWLVLHHGWYGWLGVTEPA